MKYAFLLIIFLIYILKANAQVAQWTWMGGDNVVGEAPVFGSKGVAAPANKPGARTSTAHWTDANGVFWLFGGSSSFNPFGYRNDLWKYTPATNEWTWVSGENTTNHTGNYGTKGIPSVNNLPSGRLEAAYWIDAEGNFWLFGGEGMLSGWGTNTSLNDLWKYNPKTNEWTWVSGDYEPGRPYPAGSYGTKGVAAASNRPPCRYGAMSWVDQAGNLWLMGGYGFMGYLNDLWKYNIQANEWTWMSGNSSSGGSGIYGTKGVASINNLPGGRTGSAGWVDATGQLWLFGGENNQGYFNDLWRYNPATNEWTWVGGENTPNQASSYGTRGVPAPANQPGARTGATYWTAQNSEFWLYGGATYIASVYRAYSDLWKYDLKTSSWTWVSGDNTPNEPAVYGARGVASPFNKPGKRASSSTWLDLAGNLWFYGGFVYNPGTSPYYGDLWKFSPYPEIATQALTKQQYCSGESFTVAFSVTESFNAGNIFYAELSDASGSFTQPARIGSITATSGGTIQVRIPDNALPGTKYRVRVVGSNPAVTGMDNGVDISIHAKPVVSIQPDVPGPVCSGAPVTLTAQVSGGSPPYQYYWSTTMTTASITVHPERDSVYTLRVTDPVCGDVSGSVKVAVALSGKVSLGKDTVLCEGQTMKLQTNTAYTNYLWQDGSADPELWIDHPGTYWVKVQDACGLQTADTIDIRRAEKPADFLPADTTLCTYDRLLLNPLEPYSNYLWNTGQRTPGITIDQPGAYWLEVRNAAGCVGRDSIVVLPKECLRGIYFPSAFSPDGDGKNDVYKPVVRNRIKDYLFVVYNRWGEVVFKTSNKAEGWDGSHKKVKPVAGVYVWICTYQEEGAAKRIEKGTVTLIR